MQQQTGYILRSAHQLQDVTPEQWALFPGTSKATDPANSKLSHEPNQGSNRGQNQSAAYHPFLSYAYLSALEDSGCVGDATGWLPHHLRLEDKQGQILAAAPCYLKTHSQGEYVFDHGWADALERAGGSYYPKLQISIPFTPASGPRLLTTEHPDAANHRLILAQAIRQLCDQNSLSSAHVTFVEQPDLTALTETGFLHRKDQQFHFLNHGFAHYEEFLEQFISRKRKAIKRERREALSNGIEIDWLTGSQLTESTWDQFYTFYIDTGSRKWGRPYLNRQFFSLISERMRDDILLIMARRDGRYIAGAINFIGSDRLYGRHWGCIEDHPFLHFEVCYHQAIDFAIAHQLQVVEAGAQGDHKLARGYEPVITHSAHYIANPAFRRAVENYLQHETNEVEQMRTLLTQHSPFRKHHQD